MDRLWAPWRLEFVAAPKPSGDAEPCFICDNLKLEDDRTSLIVERTEHAVVIINRFPYNNGHLLVAPKSHTAHLHELGEAEILDTQKTLARMIEKLKKLMKPDGFNVGLNLGKAAGAGLPGHLHWHIVPRWFGDVNFMPVMHDTRIIVQSLDALYELLTGTR